MAAAPQQPAERDRIAGTVARVTFHNKETGYTVIRLSPETPVPPGRLQPDKLVTLVGAMPGIEAGQPVEAEGEWIRDPKFGSQFKVDWFKPRLPTGARGIETYLASGSIKGIGPVTAKRIVETFGDRTFEILDENLDRLREVPGIGGKTLLKIVHGWREARGDRELIAFLGDHGIQPGVAARLRNTYGAAALSVVRANPYGIIGDVRGIGFMKADEIARKIGLANDAPERIDAALAHVLGRHAEEGHTGLPREMLEEAATELLGIEKARVSERLDGQIAETHLIGEVIDGQVRIFLPQLHDAETRLAWRARQLMNAERKLPRADPVATLADFEQRSRIQLAPAQREAVLKFAREGMMILTGGPGTGKTTSVRAIIDLFTHGRRQVKLAAPTGRAARRLAETAKLQAETIHRLLGYQAHTHDFARDAANPIEADLIIVDEASMLDVQLAASLLEAVAAGTCLLMVGDEDQLPSVGPGNVLGDLIASKVIPLVRLTEVFRQASQSLIVMNAHRVNRGQIPELNPNPADYPDPDFYFIERNDPQAIVEAIKMLARDRIPAKFKLDPLRDVQILTPMRRGELGVDAINLAMKSLLNPDPAENTAFFGEEPAETTGGSAPPRRRLSLTPRDRVMQISNNYDKGVFNGDIGFVQHFDMKTREAIVDFDGRAVSYLADELDQLVLAFATTIHKSQGSEYPAVIIPIHTQHWIMLQRNLIYTALTRARRLACLVGTKQALRRAVANADRGRRFTALRHFLGDASAQ